jgi:hypothetical protein
MSDWATMASTLNDELTGAVFIGWKWDLVSPPSNGSVPRSLGQTWYPQAYDLLSARNELLHRLASADQRHLDL